ERLFRRQAPARAEARFQIDGAETPEGRVPGRALAFDFVGAALDIPAFYDFLQEAVAQKAFAVRARQVPSPDGPCPLGGLELPQDFEGLCEFSTRYGHGRFPGCAPAIAPLLSYCVA